MSCFVFVNVVFGKLLKIWREYQRRWLPEKSRVMRLSCRCQMFNLADNNERAETGTIRTKLLHKNSEKLYGSLRLSSQTQTNRITHTLTGITNAGNPEQEDFVFRDDDLLESINDTNVSVYCHQLVASMLQHQKEVFTLTVIRNGRRLKLEVKLDKRNALYIIVHAGGCDEVDGGCGGINSINDIEDVQYDNPEFTHVMKWSEDRVQMAPKADTIGSSELFVVDQYMGLDTTDGSDVFICTIRVHHKSKRSRKDRFLMCTDNKEVVLTKAKFHEDHVNLKKQKSMLFQLRSWNYVTFFESLSYLGYFLSHEDDQVCLKYVGTHRSCEELEEIPDIQFGVQWIDTLRTQLS